MLAIHPQVCKPNFEVAVLGQLLLTPCSTRTRAISPLSVRCAVGILSSENPEIVYYLRNGRTARREYRKRKGVEGGPEGTLSVLMGFRNCPPRGRRNLVGGLPRRGKFCEAVFQRDYPTDSFVKLLSVPRRRARS